MSDLLKTLVWHRAIVNQRAESSIDSASQDELKTIEYSESDADTSIDQRQPAD